MTESFGQQGEPQSPNDTTSPTGSGAVPQSAGRKSSIGNAHIPQRIRRRNRLITSCMECRRRKLKCDKQNPCSNCTKFSRDCVFLAPALDSASQMKLAEIKERMGSLERTLEREVARRGAGGSRYGVGEELPGLEDGDSADDLPQPEDEKDLEPTGLATEDAAYYEDADNDLMDLGVQLGKLRVTERIGGFVRPKISEELDEALNRIPPGDQYAGVASAIQSTRDFLLPGPEYVPPSSNFVFAPDVRRSSIVEYLPSRVAADKLMEQYWVSVHPIARIVHRPTYERQYLSFWSDLARGVEPATSFQAMVLAAMLSSVISMTEEMAMLDFGVSKLELVENFQKGTETALSRAGFLRTTKLETLQAFVMYLIPLCRREVSRAHSALTGTAIRLAECMGLHRDGLHYGLSAVQVHVRRLIWYQLCFLDVRTCEATGPRPQIHREDFDTKFPLNVDDVDLESSTPPTSDSEEWTEMTISRIRFECNEMQRLIWSERPRLERKKTTITALLSKIQNFLTATEKRYSPMLKEKTPLQYWANHVYRILTSRMHVMVLQRYISTPTRQMPDRLRQITFSACLAQLEHSIAMETSTGLSSWSWYSGALQQYHAALLLLAEYCTKPIPSIEDRVWHCIDYAFELRSDLDRRTKAYVVLNELRDRMDTYRSLRRLRAPADMERMVTSPKLGMAGTGDSSPLGFNRKSSIPTPTDASMGGSGGGNTIIIEPINTSPTISRASTGLGFGSLPNGQIAFPNSTRQPAAPPPLPLPPPSLAPAASEQGAGIGGAGQPHAVRDSSGGGVTSPNDANLDIDWNEWDRIFPPEFNTSDLSFTDLGYAPPHFVPPSQQQARPDQSQAQHHNPHNHHHQNQQREQQQQHQPLPPLNMPPFATSNDQKMT